MKFASSILGLSLLLSSPALADTIYMNGTISGSPGIQYDYGYDYGHDNAGYFGPRFTSLEGAHWQMTWTGSQGSYPGEVTDVTLTVNGITIDLNATSPLSNTAWWFYDNGNMGWTQARTLVTPTQGGGWEGTQYIAAAEIDHDNIRGAIYLLDDRHGGYETNFLMTGVVGIPGPVAGTGLPGLIAACGACLAWRRRRK